MSDDRTKSGTPPVQAATPTSRGTPGAKSQSQTPQPSESGQENKELSQAPTPIGESFLY